MNYYYVPNFSDQLADQLVDQLIRGVGKSGAGEAHKTFGTDTPVLFRSQGLWNREGDW